MDYQGKLTSQAIRAPYRVVYNAAGTDISAARVPTGGRFDRFVVDHKLYHTQCASAPEAEYLVAVLNSRTVNEVIKPFQSRGLMGERDIHKKVLEVPIPLFNAKDGLHTDLAAVSREAANIAAQVVSRGLPKQLAARRAAIRSAAAEPLKNIDALVSRLLTASDA